MVNPSPKDGGFALVEVLAAMIVMTVLAVGVLAGQRGGDDTMRRSLDESRALWCLQSELERTRCNAGQLAIGARTSLADDLPGGTIETEVRMLEPGLLEVHVTVRWQVGGKPTERELTTWVAREEGR